jgi:MFS family permease
MLAPSDPAMDAVAGDRLARRNALVLALAQALAGANNTVIAGTAGIVGGVLAEKSLATVPISTYVLGMWAGTLPVGFLARRYGRLVAFEAGAFCGLLAGLVCAAATTIGSFPLLCVGTTLGGFYASGHQSYRFAAADTASERFRPRAISWVLAGGILAGVFGPQLIIVTKDILPQYMFAASYLAQAVVALVAALVLTLVRFPEMARSGATGARGEERPLGEIFRQPRLAVAVVCGVASYSMMNLIMTSAPVAMVDCQHSISDAALGLQWHVMAMYGPSFVTGPLISRFGSARVIVTGLALMALGALIGLTGITIWHFWADLVFLGLGWNFAFVGATAMVTTCHRPQERNKVQAVNDFLVFGSMAIGSFSSGQILAHYGWDMVNQVVLPIIFAAGLMLAVVTLAGRRERAA